MESHLGLKVDSDSPSPHYLSKGVFYCEQATRTPLLLKSFTLYPDVFNPASITLI